MLATACDTVSARPLVSLGVAAAAGFLIAMLLSRESR